MKSDKSPIAFCDISILKNCYVLDMCYGEICIRCNCCGRFNKNKEAIRKGRVWYHKESLKNAKRFNHWAEEPEIRKLQKKNNNEIIKFHQIKIKQLNETRYKS